MGARQLALQQRDFVVPRQRHEVDVAQAPRVVLLADAGRAGLRRRLPLEPRTNSCVACVAASNRALRVPAPDPDALRERVEVGDLLRHRSGAGDPQVARVAGEVESRLREQRRDRPQLADQFASRPRRTSGNAYVQSSTSAWCVGPFVRRRVALLRPDRLVERRIARPRLQHAQIEIEPVHLGPDERVVDVLLDRPCARRSPPAAPGIAGVRRACAASSRPCNPARRRAARVVRKRATRRRARAGRYNCRFRPGPRRYSIRIPAVRQTRNNVCNRVACGTPFSLSGRNAMQQRSLARSRDPSGCCLAAYRTPVAWPLQGQPRLATKGTQHA